MAKMTLISSPGCDLRASKFDVKATYQWPVDTNDPDSIPGFYDKFERPPYNVLFSSKTGSRKYPEHLNFNN